MNGRNSSKDFKEVVSTLNLSDLPVIQSLLDAEHIPYLVQNEVASQMRFGAGPARVLVREDHLNQARELLQNFISGKNR